MTGPVLIMSALPEELAALRGAMEDTESFEIAGHEFWRGTIGVHTVAMTTVGIGKVNAAVAATLALDHVQPRLVVFTGVAGSLDEAVHIGDVVVAERVVPHDTGTLGPDGLERYQPGHVAFLNPTERFGYEPPNDLLDRVREATAGLRLSPVLGRQPEIVFGKVATGDQFINDERERRSLHDDLGAQAVEMEGVAVAQVADQFGVPCLVIRAVSDLAGSGAKMDFDRFVAEVSANSTLVTCTVLDAV
ncbi:MAG: 5'-methylthioadenosine/adenosylhomocysteine nucleosidase [Actinomycetota bacterium]